MTKYLEDRDQYDGHKQTGLSELKESFAKVAPIISRFVLPQIVLPTKMLMILLPCLKLMPANGWMNIKNS